MPDTEKIITTWMNEWVPLAFVLIGFSAAIQHFEMPGPGWGDSCCSNISHFIKLLSAGQPDMKLIANIGKRNTGFQWKRFKSVAPSPPALSYYRLLFGEGDDVPGLIYQCSLTRPEDKHVQINIQKQPLSQVDWAPRCHPWPLVPLPPSSHCLWTPCACWLRKDHTQWSCQVCCEAGWCLAQPHDTEPVPPNWGNFLSPGLKSLTSSLKSSSNWCSETGLESPSLSLQARGAGVPYSTFLRKRKT